jgi:hypothetical protein
VAEFAEVKVDDALQVAVELQAERAAAEFAETWEPRLQDFVGVLGEGEAGAPRDGGVGAGQQRGETDRCLAWDSFCE